MVGGGREVLCPEGGHVLRAGSREASLTQKMNVEPAMTQQTNKTRSRLGGMKFHQ